VAEQKGDDRNALVLFCLFGGTRLRGELRYGCLLARMQASEQHNLPVGMERRIGFSSYTVSFPARIPCRSVGSAILSHCRSSGLPANPTIACSSTMIFGHMKISPDAPGREWAFCVASGYSSRLEGVLMNVRFAPIGRTPATSQPCDAILPGCRDHEMLSPLLRNQRRSAEIPWRGPSTGLWVEISWRHRRLVRKRLVRTAVQT
jgi:hypothetical protein